MIRTDGVLEVGGAVDVVIPPPSPSSSGGTKVYHRVAAASTNAVVVKNAPGQVYGLEVYNNAGYPVYIKFFDKATVPDPAVDPVVRTLGVQAGLPSPAVIQFGMPFSVGIALAIVKGLGDTDATPVAAGDCVLDLDYD